MTATLNGIAATHARLMIPAWGISWAEVCLDGEHTLSGAVTLKIADLSVNCTIMSGGASNGRSYYRVAAGAGGWGRAIPAKPYFNDAGVKASSVLLDAANASGETLDTTTLPSIRVGPHWEREAGPAARVLALLSPESWYVGEDGVTRLGRRPASDLKVTAAIGEIDRALGRVPIAAESIATILPGVRVDGLEALDVMHEVNPEGLRSTLWTTLRTNTLRSIIDALYPENRYRGAFEYRVVTQEGERLNLQPVRVSLGLPDVRRAFVRPGVPGCRADVALGSRVLVVFVNVDPARPEVISFEDADGAGFTPSRLDLVGADDPYSVLTEAGRPVRYGDSIAMPVGTAGTMTAVVVTGTPTGVAVSVPAVSFSRVRA